MAACSPLHHFPLSAALYECFRVVILFSLAGRQMPSAYGSRALDRNQCVASPLSLCRMWLMNYLIQHWQRAQGQVGQGGFTCIGESEIFLDQMCCNFVSFSTFIYVFCSGEDNRHRQRRTGSFSEVRGHLMVLSSRHGGSKLISLATGGSQCSPG